MKNRIAVLLILMALGLFQIEKVNCTTETIEYTNGLDLTGETRQGYENKNIIVEGGITISDNASLTLRNSNLTLLWTIARNNPQVLIEHNGILELENCNIMIRLDQMPNYSTNGRFIIRNQGKLIAVDSSIQCTHDMTIRAGGSSNLTLNGLNYSGKAESSNLHWIIEDNLPESVLIGYSHDYRLAGEASSQIRIKNSRIGFLGLYDDSNCSVLESEIDQMAPYSTKETRVTESYIDILFSNQFDTYFQLSGKLGEHYSSWNSKSILGKDNNANIHLDESSFNKIWLTLVNCTSEINEAELWLVSIYKGKATFKDSDFTILELQSGDISVESSKVDYILGDSIDGKLIIEYCDAVWVGLTGYNRETDYHVVNAEIRNSDIGTLDVNYWTHVDEVNVIIDNTQLNNVTVKPAPKYSLVFNQSRVSDTLILYPQQYEGDIFNISGSLDLENARLISYPNLFYNREYVVKVTGDGLPETGIEATIFKNNTFWKSVRTDSTGSFHLSVLWVNNTKPETPWYPLAYPMNNMTNPITVSFADSNITGSITPITSSPIIVELNPQLEEQPYLVFLIIIAVFLFVFHYSKNM